MPGLLRGVVRTAAIAGTATSVSNRVSRRQAARWSAQDAAAQPPQQYAPPPQAYAPPPAPAQPAAATDRIDQLKELAALKAQGVLSEEEFAAEKARILAG
jgi:Short C-terminal domain